MPRRIRSLVGLLLALLTLAVAGAAGTGAARAPSPAGQVGSSAVTAALLEPDLRMDGLRGFRIQNSNGRKLLRYSAEIINVGEGPLEIHGERASTSQSTMTATQWILDDQGDWWEMPVSPEAVMRYAGDGHDHWHVMKIVVTEMRPINDLNGTPKTGAKTGFCFFDDDEYDLSLPGAPDLKHYRAKSCGTQQSLTAYQGLSVGWGDTYDWDLAYQWIDITGLPDGVYRVCATADKQGWYTETNDANNHTLADIKIRAGGTRVKLLGQAWWACNDPRPAY